MATSTAANKTRLTYATYGEPVSDIDIIKGQVLRYDPQSGEIEALFDVDGRSEEMPFEAHEVSSLVLKACEADKLEAARVYIELGRDANGGTVFGKLYLAEEAAKAAASNNKEHTMSADTNNTTTLVADEPKQLNGANHPAAEPEITTAVVEQPAEAAAPEAQAEDEQPAELVLKVYEGTVFQTQSYRVRVKITPEVQEELGVANDTIFFYRERNSWGPSFVDAYKQMKVWAGLKVKFSAGRDAEEHLVLRDLAPEGEFVARAGGEFQYTGPRGQQRDERRDQGRQGQQRDERRDQGRQGQQRDNRRGQGQQRDERRGQGQQREQPKAEQPQGETKTTRFKGVAYMLGKDSLTVQLNPRAADALNKVRLAIPKAGWSESLVEAIEAGNVVRLGKTEVTFAWDGHRASDLKVAQNQSEAKAKPTK